VVLSVCWLLPPSYFGFVCEGVNPEGFISCTTTHGRTRTLNFILRLPVGEQVRDHTANAAAPKASDSPSIALHRLTGLTSIFLALVAPRRSPPWFLGLPSDPLLMLHWCKTSTPVWYNQLDLCGLHVLTASTYHSVKRPLSYVPTHHHLQRSARVTPRT